MTTTQRFNFNYSSVYPNPFFDVINHYLPTDLKTLFDWFEYVYFSNPIIATVVNKLAEYPITELDIYHSDEDVVEEYRKAFEAIDWKNFLIRVGIEYYVYGNAFAVSYPKVEKQGKCSSCGTFVSVEQIRKFKLGSKATLGKGICPKCGNYTSFDLIDIPTDKPQFTLWNPRLIKPKRNPLTGEMRYYSEVPQELKEGILSSDPFIIATTPKEVIEAIKNGKILEFPPEAKSIYHLRRPYLSGKSTSWGVSLLLPVLKHLFLIQIYRKANEVIALEHILPMRVLFPQQSSTNNEPVLTMNLKEVKEYLQKLIEHFRKDPGAIGISPIPIGEITIGGQGKLLDVSPLIQALTNEVIAGLGVPQEFVYGGLTWTGTSVSLRMLENQLQNYVGQINGMLRWMADKIAVIKGLPKLDSIKLKPFRTVDDMTRKELAADLGAKGFISKHTMLSELGFDFEQEIERIKEEQLMLNNLFPPPTVNENQEEENLDEEDELNNQPPRSEDNLAEKNT